MSKMLKQDLLWSFGGAIGLTLLDLLMFDYDMPDSLKAGLLFLFAALVITFSKELRRRRKSGSPGQE